MTKTLTVKVYDVAGKAVAEERLNPSVFAVASNPTLVQAVVTAQLANARHAIAHTKTRGDVRGGGKKPWKQKGTGRARHGSIRSPIWKGGGVTFGPRSNRNFSKKVNRKAKQKALLMTLSDKAANGKLVLLNELAFPEIKTKRFAEILAKLPVKRTVLTVLPARDEKVVLSTRNIPGVTAIRADSLNVYDILRHDCLLMPIASLPVIEKTYGAKRNSELAVSELAKKTSVKKTNSPVR